MKQSILTYTTKLKTLEGFGNKSAENLILAIQNSKVISFSKFVYGLGIKSVGEHISKLFEKYFLSDLGNFMNSSFEELESIEGVGPIVAKEVIDFWSQIENRNMVEECIIQGVIIEKKKVVEDQFLTNKTFVFTGTLSTINRREGKEIINKYGGTITNSISKKTDFLVAGVGAGAKLEKAKKLDIEILNEQDFLETVNLNLNE